MLVFPININDQCNLQKEYQWYTNLEFPVLRLVSEEHHAAPCTDTATYGSECEKCSFRYSPPTFLRFQFVYAIHNEGDGIDNQDIIFYQTPHVSVCCLYAALVNTSSSIVLSILVIYRLLCLEHARLLHIKSKFTTIFSNNNHHTIFFKKLYDCTHIR